MDIVADPIVYLFSEGFPECLYRYVLGAYYLTDGLCQFSGGVGRSVPLNKINAFGGDYCFIDGVSGHQHMARMNVSRALVIKVEEGLFDVEEAKRIGKMIFYDTPKELFHLKNV